MNKKELSMPTPDNQPRIAAVVVTYNRCTLLDRCLKALVSQDRPPDEILVIDNASTDNTQEMLRQKYDGRITHVRLEKNQGGSGGFYEGIRLAYEKGYDWIWVMDDDVEPAADALKALVVSPAFGDPAVGLLASLVLDPMPSSGTPPSKGSSPVMAPDLSGTGWLPVGFGHYKRFNSIMGFQLVVSQESLESPLIPIEAAGFLGVMIRRGAIDAVGLPLKELFIYWDDTEFIYRISRRFKVFLVPSSRILHGQGESLRSPRMLLGYSKLGASVPFAQIWKLYYYVRNETYVRTKYAKPWLAPFVPPLLLARYAAIGLFFYDHPFPRCKILCRAAFDGVLGRLGQRTMRAEIKRG
ncbi:MAG TPA: glycosyltransferase family 2 protein [Terriglobia bacterium]|nr:glycosyltransferase family 2 protein [Terriglobia bacterium]